MRLRDGLCAATILASIAAYGPEAAAQPVTGLYVGAGAGGNLHQTQDVYLRALTPGALAGRGNIRYDIGGVGVASVGYGFGNGLRLELEGNIRQNSIRNVTRTTFPTAASGDKYTYGGMVNALFDLDIGSPYVFPYLGVGGGYVWTDYDRLRLRGSTTPFLARTNDTDSSFAYQGIIGASFPIPPVVGLSLTAEYRFMGTAQDKHFDISYASPTARGRFREPDSFNHSVLLGLRYAFNVIPPPPPDAPVVAAPAVTPARTYLVFFDWDRADLTDRARQIIAEAASASQRVQTTRIEVSGHADRSGTPAYNQGLSVRRANNVAAELVRLGVPRQAISVQGFGETRPLVQTASGVREPQNRRVEIVLR